MQTDNQPVLITTQGPKSLPDLYHQGRPGVILPHEHVFVDLRTWDQPGYAQAEATDVVRLMAPELEKAKNAGITALVECSPLGVGRRVDILKVVSTAANFPLVVPTGVYREPWIPEWIHAASEEALVEWMHQELEVDIEQTGIRAGFIKLSAGDNGLTTTETKVLRAAARAAAPVQAVIGSHTIRGSVVQNQLSIIEDAGYSPQRFIWIHAQVEADFELNLAMGKRGAWIEYDAIGSDPTNPASDEFYIERIQRMLDADLGDHLLLSHDRGWYDPAQPQGGTPRPFTYLSEVFMEKLQVAGLNEALISKLTSENPYRAFARLA